MSILTKAGRQKLEDDEMANYLLEEKQRLEGIQASIELLKKRGNYDSSIILQAQLNDMMGISNSNIDTSQAERDIGNLLKKNIETSLNANKKIEGITTKVKGIEELKKEIEHDKEVEKKKKLTTINSNLKKLKTKESIKALGNKFRATRPNVDEGPLYDAFMTQAEFDTRNINRIEEGINNLRDREVEPRFIISIDNDIRTIIRAIQTYKQELRRIEGPDVRNIKAKLTIIDRRVTALKKRLDRLKVRAEYAIFFAGDGGAEEEKAGDLPPWEDLPAPAPPAPPAPAEGEEARVIEMGGIAGHGLPRMYSLLRKKSTKKGRGIAMQEVLSNFHHKPLYFNTKVKKVKPIILKDEKEKLDNLINKYDILTGEILAGNNNKQLLIQLKSLITRLVNMEKLDSDVAHEVLQQLKLIK